MMECPCAVIFAHLHEEVLNLALVQDGGRLVEQDEAWFCPDCLVTFMTLAISTIWRVAKLSSLTFLFGRVDVCDVRGWQGLPGCRLAFIFFQLMKPA